jgi:hypothetical protein
VREREFQQAGVREVDAQSLRDPAARSSHAAPGRLSAR